LQQISGSRIDPIEMNANEPPFDSNSADELVRRAKTDRDAFGELFDRHYSRILQFCTRRLFVPATAEDVASEVFLQVALAMHSFPGTSEEDFRRWLYKIATNAVHAHLRKSRRRRELIREAIDARRVVAGAAVTDRDTADWPAVYQAILVLTAREQDLITLRYFEGLTHPQIAAVLEQPAGTIRAALSRALEKLRRRLGVAEEHSALPQTEPHTNP
jgi:RNA polymerase sigma-70 factor (ECF subfamily)